MKSHENELIQEYGFSEIPLNTDVYLMDEKWRDPYIKLLKDVVNGKREYRAVGYISFAAIRKRTYHKLIVSLYPNITDRFHELEIEIPIDEFVTCIGSEEWDEKPHIFLKSEFYEHLYEINYASYLLADVSDLKETIKNNLITEDKLLNIRNEIDNLATEFPHFAFISFADNLLIKANWTVGSIDNAKEYTYSPESLFIAFAKLKEIYTKTLDCDIYGVCCQGQNLFENSNTLHISSTKNHISLNSLGTPFARLWEIEKAVRNNLKNNIHERNELYIDKELFNSLRTKNNIAKPKSPFYDYQSKLGKAKNSYFCTDLDYLDNNFLI